MLKSKYRIEFYPWGSGAHYEVRLSKFPSITFFSHKGLIFSRQLSFHEEGRLIQGLEDFSIPLPRSNNEILCFDPDVLSKLKIRSKNLKLDFSWLASDVEQNPHEYLSAVNLRNLFFELLPLDALDFDLPLIQ